MTVKWAWRSGLNETRDWFFSTKSKKWKHSEDPRFGSERMERRPWGLSWEMREVATESDGAGAKIVEMISRIGLEEGLD